MPLNHAYLYSLEDAVCKKIESAMSLLPNGLNVILNCKNTLTHSAINPLSLFLCDKTQFDEVISSRINSYKRKWIYLAEDEYVHERIFKMYPIDVIDVRKTPQQIAAELQTAILEFNIVNFSHLNELKFEEDLSFPLISGEEIIINSKDISFVQAFGDYSEIKMQPETDGGKSKYIINGNLKYIESILSNFPFFRIHKSYILNMKWVKSNHEYPKNVVYLRDGNSLPLARRRKLEFYNEYRQISKLDMQ